MCRNLFLLTCLLCASPVFAEKIVLRTGFEVDGRILERTDKFVKVDFLGTPIVYYLDEVDSIEGQKINPPVVAAREEVASASKANPVVEEPAETENDGSVEEPASAPVVKTPPKKTIEVDQKPAVKQPTPAPVTVKKPKPVPAPMVETDEPSKGKGEDKSEAKSENKSDPQKETPKDRPSSPMNPWILWGGLFLLVAAHVFTGVCLSRVAERLEKGPQWWAWAPVMNFFLMSKIAELPFQTLWFLCAVAIPWIGPIIVFGFFLFLWDKIGGVMHPPFWIRRIMNVPLVNFYTMWYLAFSKQKNLVMPKDSLSENIEDPRRQFSSSAFEYP